MLIVPAGYFHDGLNTKGEGKEESSWATGYF